MNKAPKGWIVLTDPESYTRVGVPVHLIQNVIEEGDRGCIMIESIPTLLGCKESFSEIMDMISEAQR